MIARQTAVQTAIQMKGQRNQVVDLYNTYLPHPRHYKVKYEDMLCATYVSSIFIKLGWTDIVPPECGAHQLYQNMAALGCGVQSKTRVPEIGDLIFFGNSKYVSGIQHVGIVQEVKGKQIYYYDLTGVVGRHTCPIGYSWIWGYGIPKYETKMGSIPSSSSGSTPAPAPSPSSPSTEKVEAGDLVHIKDGAKWYSGATIKASVLAKNWYVIQNKNGRVVLGMSEDERSNITSPIHEEDVTIVRKANSLTHEDPVEQKVSITLNIAKDTNTKLQNLAKSQNLSVGEIIDKLIKDI